MLSAHQFGRFYRDPMKWKDPESLPPEQLAGQLMWAFGTSPDINMNGQTDVWEHVTPHFIAKAKDLSA